jgi:hypothetical protein
VRATVILANFPFFILFTPFTSKADPKEKPKGLPIYTYGRSKGSDCVRRTGIE